MTTYKEMEIVRNFVAEVFGESKVTELKYNKQTLRYHNEHHYSFKINNKKPLSITLITGFEPHYKEAIYELMFSQEAEYGKIKSKTVKLTKETAKAGNIIYTLQDDFKMPINKQVV